MFVLGLSCAEMWDLLLWVVDGSAMIVWLFCECDVL